MFIFLTQCTSDELPMVRLVALQKFSSYLKAVRWLFFFYYNYYFVILWRFIILSKIVRLVVPVTHLLQHYQNNALGGGCLGAGNVLGAWALDKRLVFPAESACVWIIKGRYTGLQSGPINGPSSSRHTGGSLIKISPYGVSPATSQCFIQGLAHTHSC